MTVKETICPTYPPLFTPTRFSFSIDISTSCPLVIPSSLLLTAKNASVDETTIAALPRSSDFGNENDLRCTPTLKTNQSRKVQSH